MMRRDRIVCFANSDAGPYSYLCIFTLVRQPLVSNLDHKGSFLKLM